MLIILYCKSIFNDISEGKSPTSINGGHILYADIDEDKVNETIELFGEVTMSKEGQIINSNDRNKWCLVVNKGKKQFVLFNDYIQVGKLDFWAYDLMDYKQFRITTAKSATASLVFTDYIFNKESECF